MKMNCYCLKSLCGPLSKTSNGAQLGNQHALATRGSTLRLYVHHGRWDTIGKSIEIKQLYFRNQNHELCKRFNKKIPLNIKWYTSNIKHVLNKLSQ